MPKILVADDNSNVQKTVALALADLGVEVIAVNNGEAAVRKLSDVLPDLILADIFMPVRNGYEVCEYVKKDSRYSHVPVVLLVGAFDPLDEREAQRVGADGILKKPFVPPDPLMAMVKTLLDRTLGDRLVTVAAVSKPAVAAQSKAPGIAAAEERRTPPASLPEMSEELPIEEYHPPVDRLSFGEGERPMAFSQLLDVPAKEPAVPGAGAVEPVDDEQILTSSRDASLGDPIFWRTEEPKSESQDEVQENSEAEGEGEEDSAEVPMRAWTPDEEAKARAEAEFLHPVEPFELVREEDESAETPTIVESSPSIAQDAASQASLNVESAKPEDLAANPIEWMASIPAPSEEEAIEAAADWSAADSESDENIEAIEAAPLKSAPEAPAPPSPAAAVAPVSASPSVPVPLAAIPPPLAALAAQPQARKAAEIPDPHKTQPSLKPLPQSARDTAHSIPKQDWADLAASLQVKPSEPVAEKPKPEKPPVAQAPAVPAANAQPVPASAAQLPAATASLSQPASAIPATPSAPDPALVEAVVQRVLDKMRPQVVDIITKEFLRPVVQALVTREVTKHS